MCGIFAYLNYNVNRERRHILEVLFNGLRRLEYRGYDSAGISIDSSLPAPSVSGRSNGASSDPLPVPLVFRQAGNIESLVKSVYEGQLQFLETLILSWGKIRIPVDFGAAFGIHKDYTLKCIIYVMCIMREGKAIVVP
ncbi:Glutamine--fructose-6-phosphate aminotransferase [isomerizing] 2 [Sarracenia purpurea var. burkii]